MEEFYDRMIEIGGKLGLTGEKLQEFVEEKYARLVATEDRETRLKERNLEKEMIEKEIERERMKRGVSEEAPRSSHSHVESRAKIPKLPPFDDSKENIEDYLQRFERYAHSVGWDPADRALHLSALLKGKALAVYSRLSSVQAADYEILKEALYKRFQLSEDGFRKRFRNSSPETGETPTQFVARIEHYLLRWMELGKVDPNFEDFKDLILREQFLNSCGRNLSMFLKEKKLHSIADVIDEAEKYVEAHGYFEFIGKRVNKSEGAPDTNSWNKKVEVDARDKGESRQKCYGCGKSDHKIRDCKLVKQSAAALVQENRPFGTDSRYQNVSRGSSMRGRGRSRGSVRGFGGYRRSDDREITETDHKVGCCLDRKPLEFELVDELPMMSVACKVPIHDVGSFNKMPTTEGYIEDVKVTVLRDTGCSGVVVRRDLVSASNLTGEVQQCVLVDGTVRKFPKAQIEIQTPYFSGKTEALCVERPVYPLIIGNIPGIQENQVHTEKCVESEEKTEKVSTMPEEDGREYEENEIEVSKVADLKLTEDSEQIQANVVQTRAQVIKEKEQYKSLKVPCPIAEVSREEIKRAQETDETLKPLWALADTGEKKNSGKWNTYWYTVQKGLLYRQFQSAKHNRGSLIKQLVVPKPYRESVKKLGHESLLSGHLGFQKSVDKIMNQFHWPGILSEVKRFCRSCEVCQRTFPKGKVTKAPLGDMPLIETPFQRIAVDLIGPISPPSEKGHRYILTVVDYATRYPEACALKTIETVEVAEALVQVFCRVGVPREILSDQGTQFLSSLMAEVSRLLSMKQLVTSPYHPACNGLAEKMNGTLKTMIKRMCAERPKDWDRYIDPALFAYREAPQASTGFSPFDLIYGWKVRGPLEILREVWTKDIESEDVKTVYQYVIDLRERLEETLGLAHQELSKSKEKYKAQYNKKSRLKNLKVGDKALILLPTKSNKLLMQWQGPFVVKKKVGDLDYQLEVRGKTKTYHANMLKQFVERKEPEQGIMANVCCALIEEEVSLDIEGFTEKDLNTEGLVLPNLVKKESTKDVKIGSELGELEQTELTQMLEEFEDILTDLPGKTHLTEHEIRLTTQEPIRTRQYPLPFAMEEIIEKEVESMLNLDIIEPSESPYCSPVVLVLKTDNSYRFCVDMRKINQATVFDSEPMPNPEQIMSKLSKCKYFSKIDLSKGYWQIPMSDACKPYTAFATSSGLWQFKRMPFGLVTAPSSFSRMMRKLLKGLKDLENFLDDILVFTITWRDHMLALRALFERIREACLTARPSKCLLGFESLEFLGHNVGEGELKPVCSKIQSIADAPRPKTKKQLRSFLGLVGFYRKFIPNFACKAVPLTDLTRKNCPNVLRWEEVHDHAFDELKRALTKFPILRLPDMDKAFILRTDASQFGIGAVLLQEWSDGKFPIGYASRKLLPREVNYSVIEKECLAIVWGVQKYRQYLYGAEFVLETDHAPLLYLNKNKGSNSRIMRWALGLQSYRFRIVAIKGTENIGADFLSRVADSEDEF